MPGRTADQKASDYCLQATTTVPDLRERPPARKGIKPRRKPPALPSCLRLLSTFVTVKIDHGTGLLCCATIDPSSKSRTLLQVQWLVAPHPNRASPGSRLSCTFYVFVVYVLLQLPPPKPKNETSSSFKQPGWQALPHVEAESSHSFMPVRPRQQPSRKGNRLRPCTRASPTTTYLDWRRTPT